ncbi:unnamed protein product [Alopecurus aequalis]
MAPPVPHLPDEIREEIFLRLPTPAALARAATAHPSFRHIITMRSFLRRFRKLHPPPLLGFADSRGFHPSEAPHPSAPLARALAAAADFTYSFVPAPNREYWIPRDIRDGRVLLEDRRRCPGISKNLAVCDPLSRRYVLLPSIPENLKSKHPFLLQIEPILAALGEDEDETSFKVICFANYTSKLVAFVFSPVTKKWCLVASASWSSLGTDCSIGWHNHSYLGFSDVSYFNCIRGCFYSASPWEDKLLMLDTRTIAFPTKDYLNDPNLFPPNHLSLRCLPGQERSLYTNVVGRDGALERFYLVRGHSPNGSFDLYHKSQKNNGKSSKEWQLENIISLPEQYDYSIVGAAEGFLFLGVTAKDNEVWDWKVDYFSLEIQTSELKKICRMMKSYSLGELACSYFGFPLSLSKPSI